MTFNHFVVSVRWLVKNKLLFVIHYRIIDQKQVDLQFPHQILQTIVHISNIFQFYGRYFSFLEMLFRFGLNCGIGKSSIWKWISWEFDHKRWRKLWCTLCQSFSFVVQICWINHTQTLMSYELMIAENLIIAEYLLIIAQYLIYYC